MTEENDRRSEISNGKASNNRIDSSVSNEAYKYSAIFQDDAIVTPCRIIRYVVPKRNS